MAQIQNFGFIAHVQESDVQHPPRQSGRAWQQRGQPKSLEYALCYPNHSGADGERLGSHFPFGYDHIELTHGAVSAVQVPASPSPRSTAYQDL